MSTLKDQEGMKNDPGSDFGCPQLMEKSYRPKGRDQSPSRSNTQLRECGSTTQRANYSPREEVITEQDKALRQGNLYSMRQKLLSQGRDMS